MRTRLIRYVYVYSGRGGGGAGWGTREVQGISTCRLRSMCSWEILPATGDAPWTLPAYCMRE